MPTNKNPRSSKNKSITIGGDVRDGTVIIGDNNTVNQTIIQKFFNIFKSDAETLEQRNRRILLNHVENAWIKGVLDASLYGAAMLDLGIKETPEAITNKNPWALKKESTDETLPAGISMREIFDSIGMGRSLLILGAPGSGKTTMLLELARGLIARAREDVTQSIPMVFNLASWIEEKQILNTKKGLFSKRPSPEISGLAPFGNWLVNELNNIYLVPQISASELIKENKLFLLLDGLDEVRQENRAKCIDAINTFRKEHGLTSLVVCSRNQDYIELNTKLSFEGAIEVQPLTQGQIAEFFNRFGDEMAGIRQALENDTALREMAEAPLFLSIMLMAYRYKQEVDILAFEDQNAQRKHLFETYIEHMFERSHSKNAPYKKQDVLHWLSWLAGKMIEHNEIPYKFENMQPNWLPPKNQIHYYKSQVGEIFGEIYGFMIGSSFGLTSLLIDDRLNGGLNFRSLSGVLFLGLFGGLIGGLIGRRSNGQAAISTDFEYFDLKKAKKDVPHMLNFSLSVGLFFGLFFGLFVIISGKLIFGLSGLAAGFLAGLIAEMMSVLFFVPIMIMAFGHSKQQVFQTITPGQRLIVTARNFLSVSLVAGLFLGLFFVLIVGQIIGLKFIQDGLVVGLFVGLIFGPMIGLLYGGDTLIKHYTLRRRLAFNNLLPWRLVPFLDHCVDLIFLRRVGGGYIFIHRLLMERFAEMYVETTK